MHLMYLMAIAAAERSIDLQAAYFVPDELIMKALIAARHRGVRVRVNLPGKHIDSETVRLASKAHWGELLLFWHQRADGLARAAGLERSITEYLQQNVWITASGMLDLALLQHALAVTTPDRILFSTDYPFQQPTRQQIETFLAAFPDDDARTAFVSGNARALYGMG